MTRVRFNSVRLFNADVKAPGVTNTLWLAMFALSGLEGLTSAVRYIAIIPRQFSSTTYLHVDTVLFVIQVTLSLCVRRPLTPRSPLALRWPRPPSAWRSSTKCDIALQVRSMRLHAGLPQPCRPRI